MQLLIIKTSAFGDIVQCYGVLEYLQARLPDATVDWVVESRMKELIQPHPGVSNCLEIDTKRWRTNWWHPKTLHEIGASIKAIRQKEYDVVFDLQSNVKSALLTYLARSRNKVGFGFKTAHEPFSAISLNRRIEVPAGLNIRQEYLYIVQKYFEDYFEPTTTTLLHTRENVLQPSANWLVCPGSNWKNKQLTEKTLKEFLALCKAAYNPTYLFLCASAQEIALANALAKEFPGSSLLCKPPLSHLQAISATMDLVLSMDSLPLHLTSTSGCATYSFFGPSSGAKFSPLGPQHGFFQGACPYGQTFVKRCSKLRSCPTGACLRDQSADALFSAFSSWYRQSPD